MRTSPRTHISVFFPIHDTTSTPFEVCFQLLSVSVIARIKDLKVTSKPVRSSLSLRILIHVSRTSYSSAKVGCCASVVDLASLTTTITFRPCFACCYCCGQAGNSQENTSSLATTRNTAQNALDPVTSLSAVSVRWGMHCGLQASVAKLRGCPLAPVLGPT